MHESQESRTLIVGEDIRQGMYNLAVDAIEREDKEALMDGLPLALSTKEIGDLGIQVSSHAESSIWSSYDGVSHGRSIERDSIYKFGKMRLLSGDLVTAQNAAEHLKSLDIRSKLGWLMLK